MRWPSRLLGKTSGFHRCATVTCKLQVGTQKARKQYRYHADWTALRASKKFDHLVDFGTALPGLRRRILRDLRNNDAGDRSFAIAAVLALIDRACLRIGSAATARENGVYGATTLRSRHVDLSDGSIQLNYRAKGGQQVTNELRETTLNQVFAKLDDLPGQDLMTWINDDGEAQTVTAGEVNAFLTGYLENDALTAKTFRTWNGAVAALDAFFADDTPSIKALTEAAAQRLHNTPAIARSSYIHPTIIDLVSDPEPASDLMSTPGISGLRQGEVRLLELLRKST